MEIYMKTHQDQNTSSSTASIDRDDCKALELGLNEENGSDQFTRDGSLDRHGNPGLKKTSGGWKCAFMILVNQGLVSLAFTGVEVNMVLFTKSVLRQTNADASNSFTRWIGTLYLCTLFGAFISDSYLGRYLTCVTFQLVSIVGLVALSIYTHAFLLKPEGCGKVAELCDPHTSTEVAIFYILIYLIALGNGAPDPALAAFGADQFDEEDPKEKQSKASFYSYFYVALNLGSLFSETVLVYIENMGYWVSGFWVSTACAVLGYLLLLSGSFRYRHFKASGNPISRFSQVIVASFRKIKLHVPPNGDGLYEISGTERLTSSTRRILDTSDFKFLDKAAIITQVEEVKCILRLLPIWLCTILSSVAFIQMISLFVEQGAAMKTQFSNFHFPPASMTACDIITTSCFIILYDRLILPLYIKLTKKEPQPPSELQRIGIGLAIAIVAMVLAGLVEQQRRRYAAEDNKETSSMNILWQTPQYVLVGISEAFVYVAQMEFFASQMPDALKSIGISLSMSSTAIGSYSSSWILSLVMGITTRNGSPGWVPPNLNHGHLDWFFFLSAGLMALNLGIFTVCAKRYKPISLEERNGQ